MGWRNMDEYVLVPGGAVMRRSGISVENLSAYL